MAADDKQGSWWQTVPGVITAVATLLGALTGLIIALNQAGLLRGSSPATKRPLPESRMVEKPAQTATLPSVTGVPVADAKQVLRSLGFTYIREVRKFSAAVPGTVIEQVPNPGTNLPVDQLVNLMVAAHPRSASLGQEFTGIWEEGLPLAPQDRGHPTWLKLLQNGSELTIWISYTGSFTGPAFGHALVNGSQATWTLPQSCAQRFQHRGYDYDNPGSNTFTLRLDGSILWYEAQTRWTSPCDGHSVGTETVRKRLQRARAEG